MIDIFIRFFFIIVVGFFCQEGPCLDAQKASCHLELDSGSNSYKKSNKKMVFSTTQEQGGLNVQASVLNHQQIKKHAASINPAYNVSVASKYKVIQLSFENKTPYDYIFYPEKMDITYERPQKIRKALRTNIGYFPILAGIGFATLLVGVIGFAYVPSVIAGFVVGVSTSVIDTDAKNKRATHNLQNRALDQHPVAISSCQTVTKLVFIEKKKFNRMEKLIIPLHGQYTEKTLSFTLDKSN